MCYKLWKWKLSSLSQLINVFFWSYHFFVWMISGTQSVNIFLLNQIGWEEVKQKQKMLVYQSKIWSVRRWKKLLELKIDEIVQKWNRKSIENIHTHGDQKLFNKNQLKVKVNTKNDARTSIVPLNKFLFKKKLKSA